ncbi:MAG: hypothetical protein JKY37_08030 [Nannocystaceae bacterium]|nr:hypothetical protein [Nannocystaceae bacterium]
MTPPIQTAEQAVAFLQGRVRKGIVMSVVTFFAVQALITAAMLGSTYADIGFVSFAELDNVVVVGRGGGTPVRFWPMFWLSIVVLGVFFAAFGVWFTRRRMKHARRLLPRIRQGTRMPGTVTGTRTETEKRGSMQYTRLRLTVVAEDGREYQAVHEEPVGTELPTIDTQSPAVVWASPSGYVIAAGDGLFEGP